MNRLEKVKKEISEMSLDDLCFWTMIDRRLEQIGVPFEKENYDELEY